MQPRRGDRERVAPPGLHGNFIGPEFQGLRSPSARSTPGYRRSPLRGCMALGPSPAQGLRSPSARSTPGYRRSPLRGCMALGPNSRGCARLRLAPPLATVGRPSGAALIVSLALQGLRSPSARSTPGYPRSPLRGCQETVAPRGYLWYTRAGLEHNTMPAVRSGGPMGQSYTCLHYHLVFSTKNRSSIITLEMRPRLWEYLGGIVRGQRGIPVLVGGTADHVHLLVTLRQEPALAAFLRELKAGSSRWVHDTYPADTGFAWQTGYGAFTVSHSGLEVVKAYIANQEEHHRSLTFQDEFRALLSKHGIEFDEKYLWD